MLFHPLQRLGRGSLCPLRALPQSKELLQGKNKPIAGLKKLETPPGERKKQELAGESNPEKKSKQGVFQPSGVLGAIQHPGACAGVGRGGCTKGLACPCPCPVPAAGTHSGNPWDNSFCSIPSLGADEACGDGRGGLKPKNLLRQT